MAWLRDAPVVVFFFMLGMALLLAALGLGMGLWSFRLAGALRGRKPVPVDELADGYQLVHGRASGPVLAAPLTGRPCVWWEVRVWERSITSLQDSEGGSDRRAEWSERRHDSSLRVVQCTQGLTVCAVQPLGMTLTIPTEVCDWQGQQFPPENRDPESQPGTAFMPLTERSSSYAIVGGTLRGDRFRYREEIIVPGSELFVLGQVQRVDSATWEEAQEPPVDPGILADQAAAQAGGVQMHSAPAPLDGEPEAEAEADAEEGPDAFGRVGWSEAIDRQNAAAMQQAQWQVGKHKGKHYVMAVQAPELWVGMPQQAAQGGWIMGALFTGLAMFMLWVRFGAA
ncbi:hypothetical protein [Acidovorax sp. FJL06]|uniref:hypothetical protein n=1 Tax=Acidovorax sp. FJL06 TaxID=2153365 RepID=UPI000F5835F2|nr:hypothetical protein [Acidovorax sp. FJL06]